MKKKRKSLLDQKSTNMRASKVTSSLLEQPNTQRNASAVPTGHTPELSRLEIITVIEK